MRGLGSINYQVQSRIDDLLVVAGGLSIEANRDYVSKNINRALKLSDGQKIYIPTINEKSDIASFKTQSININNASLEELDSLSGIGPTLAKSIIEQRPYSNIDELQSKGILKKNVFEKIKDKITAY